MTINGRGAWTSKGMPTSNSVYYEYLSPVAVGSTPERGDDYRAVTLGVKAYQTVFNTVYGQSLVADGWWGVKTTASAKIVQTRLNVTSDGVVGPATSKAIALPLTRQRETLYSLPSGVLCGLVKQESSFDFGAVGYTTPADKGLVQINLPANPSVTEEQAFNPFFSLDYAAARLKKAYEKFKRWDCAVASYNSPLWAQQWYATGHAPNEQIAAYVATILAGCS